MNTVVAKIVVFESTRTSKIRKQDENHPPPQQQQQQGLSAIKRCLFGVSDPADTEILLQEQYEIDRARFRERFGIDVDMIDNLDKPDCRNSSDSSSKNFYFNCNKSKLNNGTNIGSEKRKMLNRKRKVFSPYNKQAVLTDFFKARKSLHGTKDNEKNIADNN